MTLSGRSPAFGKRHLSVKKYMSASKFKDTYFRKARSGGCKRVKVKTNQAKYRTGRWLMLEFVKHLRFCPNTA